MRSHAKQALKAINRFPVAELEDPRGGVAGTESCDGTGGLTLLVRGCHLGGVHQSIEVRGADVPQLEGCFFQRQPLLVGMLSDGAGFFVPNTRR